MKTFNLQVSPGDIVYGIVTTKNQDDSVSYAVGAYKINYIILQPNNILYYFDNNTYVEHKDFTQWMIPSYDIAAQTCQKKIEEMKKAQKETSEPNNDKTIEEVEAPLDEIETSSIEVEDLNNTQNESIAEIYEDDLR